VFLTDFGYWLFVLLAVVLYYVLPQRSRPYLLVSTGLFFYFYFAGKFALLVIVEVLLIYVLIHLHAKRKIGLLFYMALCLAIAVLVFFKYSGMLADTIQAIMPALANPGLFRMEQIIIPLALSYITFELIHYTVEMHRGCLPGHRLHHFLSFIFFVPTLVAGPIKRFEQFLPELKHRFAWHNIAIGVTRIGIGLFKKIVLADTLNLLVEPLNHASSIGHSSPLVLWTGLVAYSLVIYFDFSGYSDIAIGTARLLGIKLPENFRFPYMSRNIAEFWNRWHISLGKWLTQYVYFPLGGSRGSHVRTSLNLVITLGVSGLWHGAAWHFVVWGLSHGLMLAIHRSYKKLIKPKLRLPIWCKPFTETMAVLSTFGFVVVSRVFFILPISEAVLLLRRLFV